MFKYQELTHKIIGCAMVVHSKFGPGYMEVVYQRSLAVEFDEQDLMFARELSIDMHYKDKKVGARRVDFLVEDKVLVEIKAVSQLENVHLAQAKNYLEAFNMDVGLLINFGSTKLQFNRLFK